MGYTYRGMTTDVDDLGTMKLMKRAAEDGLYYIVRLHRDLPGLTAVMGDAVRDLKQAKEIAAQMNRTAAPHELYKCRKVRQPKPAGVKKPGRKPR
jgi:hypothetical protein